MTIEHHFLYFFIFSFNFKKLFCLAENLLTAKMALLNYWEKSTGVNNEGERKNWPFKLISVGRISRKKIQLKKRKSWALKFCWAFCIINKKMVKVEAWNAVRLDANLLWKRPWEDLNIHVFFWLLTFKLGTPIMGGCSSSLLLLLLLVVVLLLVWLLPASMVVKLLFRMLLLMLIQVEFDSAKLLRVRLPTKWWFLQKGKQSSL